MLSTVGRDHETCGSMSVTNTSAVKKEAAAAAVSPASLEAMEQQAQQTYRPPGHPHTTPGNQQPQREVDWVRNTDGTLLIDHKGRPITVDRMLATKPLRGELSTRPGPGNRKLTYLSGEGVTRTLNDIFGFDGWNLDIKKTQREVRSDLACLACMSKGTCAHLALFLYERNVSRMTKVAFTSRTQPLFD